MSVLKLSSTNFSNEVTSSEKPVLIDFWASWCGPCKMMSPIVDQIAEETDTVKICKVNVDDEPELAQTFGIMSIPTLVVMKDGKVVNQSVGVKSKDSIMNMIEEL